MRSHAERGNERLLFLSILSLLAGCVAGENSKGLPLVTGNPFGAAPVAVVQANLPKPDADIAARTDFVGKTLLAKNRQIKMEPVFAVIGSPGVEIFHDKKMIYVTEGLVRKCQNEQQLAAVLAQELGKMVAEQSYVAASGPGRSPPISLPIGNDHIIDPTSQTEQAYYEKDRQERLQNRPNPQQLAQVYLLKAGYAQNSLELATPILSEADRTCTWERQIKGLPASGGR